MKIPWFLIIFFAIFLVIGMIAAVLARILKEKKLLEINNIQKASVYVKFINIYKKAEDSENRGETVEAVQYYERALQLLRDIPNKDELLIENINNIENKIKILDNRQKKVHNK